jgi:hypothetical protein
MKFLLRFDWTLAARGGAHMKLHKVKNEPQNSRISIFDIRYSLFQSFFFDYTGRSAARGWAEP